MSSMQIEPTAALGAARDLQRIAQEVAALLAEMRPDLEAPEALKADDDTARSILKWYSANADTLGKTIDVVATNSDTLGNGAQQFIDIMQDNDEQAKADIQKIAPNGSASATPATSGSGDVRA
jgi:hypothetical protein